MSRLIYYSRCFNDCGQALALSLLDHLEIGRKLAKI